MSNDGLGMVADQVPNANENSDSNENHDRENDGLGMVADQVPNANENSDSNENHDRENVGDLERGRVSDGDRPVCPEHYCLMVSNGTKGSTAHYKCQVPGCKNTQKVARPLVPAPKEPTFCPLCKNGPKRDGKGKKVACVVDKKARRYNVVMCCPKEGCDFRVEVPRGFEQTEKKRVG